MVLVGLRIWVSIPSRYDPNKISDDDALGAPGVSIPSRYDPNHTPDTCRCLLILAVSIPSRYDPNWPILWSRALACSVSIPSRYDPNPDAAGRWWNDVSWFQSLQGTIPTCGEHWGNDNRSQSFNPFKVRSQLHQVNRFLPSVRGFNPFKVRSQLPEVISTLRPGIACFNPFKVRSQQRVPILRGTSCAGFQSLQGTIPTARA